MTSLAQAIRTYQSSGASRDEFLILVDSALSVDDTSPGRLLEILREEQARTPLPADLYAAVHRRIEQASLASHGADAEETRLQTSPGALQQRTPPPFSSQPASPPASQPASQSSPPARDFVISDTDQVKEVGDTLNGRFVLEECLGVGGMGTVYKALDLRKLEASDRRPYIAIKVLNLQFRGNPKSLIALQREAKKAQALGHRNIVTVYDFDRDGPVVYLTMEYLSGKPLSRILRTPEFKGMPYAEALPIFKGMANALAYAHERGFVHCDFKPANVFLTDTGEVKVIDFGIARVFQRPEEETDVTIFDPGSLGALTPAYASPEMLEHREPDPRDDIYALGCTTYELLTGRHPFDRVPATQARSSGLKPQRPDGLGTRQWRALRTSLAFERNARMPTVTHFLQEFGDTQKLSGLSGAAVKAAVSAGVVAVVAAGGYFYASSHRTAPQENAAAPAEKVIAAPVMPAVPALSLATVAPVLASVPCSALVASVQDQVLSVSGYLGRSYGTQKLRTTLSQIPGVTNPSVQVQEVDDDKCDMLKLIAPYLTTGRPASIQTRDHNTQLTEGQPLIVQVTTPPYDSWVNIDYFQLDGSVVHLLPNARSKDNQAPPNYAATIGSAGDWIVSKPFGSEMIVLLVTPTALFDTIRPDSEPRADYLRAVEKRLADIANKFGRDKIAVDLVQIDTHPRKQ
ncbi:Serine/threonine-protein kinase PknD (plasmid) [Caballeronia sp. SBC1]|uniref:serine/threonine protein kinase n=1 Tax=unclassified Caballeronia TaxID=2646786 RepID=UPI0013E172FD|nr:MULTISPECIES: serine/threonine protein kinase [unclassified Caballeronia]QIE26288.1 Serine/threonine-protein kinase PknD [Caballeronia sp. SBC2]QIN64399.1 Serine/threonine-protein kinase PknD [Caballeronia sp. SBC1]